MKDQPQHDAKDQADDAPTADVSDERRIVGTGTPDDARSWDPEMPAETEDD